MYFVGVVMYLVIEALLRLPLSGDKVWVMDVGTRWISFGEVD